MNRNDQAGMTSRSVVEVLDPRGVHRRRSARPGRPARRAEPISTIRPSSTTAIRSARIAVESRWATMIAVRPSSSASRPASTWASDLRSRFDVASSRTSTRGSARKARASAMSWRSPDDSETPRSWTGVSTPSGRRSTSSVRPTRLTASLTSSSVADGPGEGDVVAERAREQERLLGDDAELASERLDGDVAQVVAVDEDAALGRVVEAGDELGDRRLARARRADERHGLAGSDVEVDVAQHGHGRVVPEGHVVERRSRPRSAAAARRPAPPRPTGASRAARRA